MSIGIPIKVFHEAKGHTVTVELKTGELYRGTLAETEDNMNCQMSNITYTARDGRVTNLEQVYIRGSKIRFMILPDMLKNAPMFRAVDTKSAAGRGKGAGVQKALGGRGIGRGFGRPSRGRP
ncbi:Small nuclear ribonucleoprotein Sm D3 [Balamuthia mandrillaris]